MNRLRAGYGRGARGAKGAVFVLTVLLTACASQPASSPPQQALPAPSGAETFATHCAACHGVLGEGDGPVAASIKGQVPNLRTLTQRYGGEFPADLVASYVDGRNLPPAHGQRGMPVWGEVFDATARLLEDAVGAESRIDAVVAYLRELQRP